MKSVFSSLLFKKKNKTLICKLQEDRNFAIYMFATNKNTLKM